MHDCIGSLQYWVPLHWHCVSMIDIAASSPPRYCSTAAAAESLMNADTRYTAHYTAAPTLDWIGTLASGQTTWIARS